MQHLVFVGAGQAGYLCPEGLSGPEGALHPLPAGAALRVAHAGGVDPETSHSTIEMRAAHLRFTLPLFHLSNVEIIGIHAHIVGTRAN